MNKKVSKKNKSQRRNKEIIRAQSKSSIRDFTNKVVDDNDVNATNPKKATHNLDLRIIKTDLIKTGLFATLVIIFLIILKTQNLEFDFGINK